jgi:hypothetical protein
MGFPLTEGLRHFTTGFKDEPEEIFHTKKLP